MWLSRYAHFPFIFLLCTVPYTLSQCNRKDIVGSVQVIDDGEPITLYVAQTAGANGRVSLSGDTLRLKHNSRVFLTDSCANFNPYNFHIFPLTDNTISFDVDVSTISCGCNAAFYMISMPAVDDFGEYDPTFCGDYYCDANYVCGPGCPEMDLFEGNRFGMHSATHYCESRNVYGYYTDCDRDGCGLKAYEKVGPYAYGPGSAYTIDTRYPFTVQLKFVSSDGWLLTSIETTLKQGSKSFTMVSSDDVCGYGEMMMMSNPIHAGMALAISYWGSDGPSMAWLNSPPCDPNVKCDTTKTAIFSNIQIIYPVIPTVSPTPKPTSLPTRAPTPSPTSTPTSAPSAQPTVSFRPTSIPTEVPTSQPTITFAPTVETDAPTASPTHTPTFSPTRKPSPAPTSYPTDAPVTRRPTLKGTTKESDNVNMLDVTTTAGTAFLSVLLFVGFTVCALIVIYVNRQRYKNLLPDLDEDNRITKRAFEMYDDIPPPPPLEDEDGGIKVMAMKLLLV